HQGRYRRSIGRTVWFSSMSIVRRSGIAQSTTSRSRSMGCMTSASLPITASNGSRLSKRYWHVVQPRADGSRPGLLGRTSGSILSEDRMSAEKPERHGPDLGQGIELSTVPDGTMLLGHVDDEPVLLARRGEELFAIGAFCTHYGAPLDQGVLVGETLRCPWHHACFSLRTGQALRAPAPDPVSCWRVEIVFDPVRQFTSGEMWVGAVYVREKLISPAARPRSTQAGTPESVMIVGGGAAGNAAAETLRREGYSGRITMLSADEFMPCDRP